MRRVWTVPELKTLTEIYTSGRPLAANLHLFGGRSIETIRAKARAIGLVHQSLPTKIRELMAPKDDAAAVPRTAAEVAELLSAEKRSVRDVLSAMVLRETAHIVEWRGSYHEIVYVFGPGENAPKPLSATPAAYRKRLIEKRRKAAGMPAGMSDTEVDEMYRAGDNWWPRADPVVVSSIDAMVRSKWSNHA
ncbi:hypothetical protein B0G76_2865 [Paraburkholderia sp. BL23I1N1]|uniref:hypothetical protein n=1 Tax=Paraburkholderia sp. BL23I1N1 TaxID=1938802 RepID=UPI000E76A0CF|nr:hypothetical protein [Paraburkholderia sp. BL23I1N1]RKE36663.1 hypothetical protein B0G76_2865 [Paraburkholderia sp. BL23I1N1]